MRFLGNKTKLLGAIEGLLTERGITGGTLVDIFSGSSSVGRHFKRRGFRVVANDLLASAYTQAVAGVEVSHWPRFDGCRELLRLDSLEVAESAPERRPLAEAIAWLDTRVEPREGLIFRNFCPGGSAGRLYYTDENGRQLDGQLELLRTLWRERALTHGELHLLLASILDAADRVANISGTYGAFLKRFQPSALRPLRLSVPEVIESDLEHLAIQGDANSVIGELDADVLYIDPPYNNRQYAANYHLPEIIAGYVHMEDPAAFEASLYGKTGLFPYAHLRSTYCVAPRANRRQKESVADVFERLIQDTRAKHIVVSYNEEGLLGRDRIAATLAAFSGQREFDFDEGFREVVYKRFQSDRDRQGGAGEVPRSYRVVEGKRPGEIGEWLFFASRTRVPDGSARAR